jgi:CysZ protein
MRAAGAGAAIAAALKDVFGGRLGWLALLCLVAALGATVAAAWAGLRYLVPLIPEGQGNLAFVYAASEWIAAFGVIVLSIALAPAASMIVGGALFDVAAARVEKAIGAPKGRVVPLGEGLANGVKIALPALALNLISLPLLFVPVVNIVWFLILNGALMGREYATLAATRRMGWREARALRRRLPVSVFLIGLVCSVIPFVAPLIGASAMTRLVNQAANNGSGTRA